jgi:hypothetical protein
MLQFLLKRLRRILMVCLMQSCDPDASPTRFVVTQCLHLSTGRAPSPAVAFDDGLLPIDNNWSYFEKLGLVPQAGPLSNWSRLSLLQGSLKRGRRECVEKDRSPTL